MRLKLTESQYNLLKNLLDNHMNEQRQYIEDAKEHGEDVSDKLEYIKSVAVLYNKIRWGV